VSKRVFQGRYSLNSATPHSYFGRDLNGDPLVQLEPSDSYKLIASTSCHDATCPDGHPAMRLQQGHSIDRLMIIFTLLRAKRIAVSGVDDECGRGTLLFLFPI
jgi:hypothetical protein